MDFTGETSETLSVATESGETEKLFQQLGLNMGEDAEMEELKRGKEFPVTVRISFPVWTLSSPRSCSIS